MSIPLLSLLLLATLAFLGLLLAAAIASFSRLFFEVPFRAGLIDSLKSTLPLMGVIYILVMVVRLFRHG
jgi:hypothetical protein